MAIENQPETNGGESSAAPGSRTRPRLRGHIVVGSDDELIVVDHPADPPAAPKPSPPGPPPASSP